MSDMLAIGASGLRAYQVALNTVSENIANAGTAGYTRRTTNIKEVASIGGISAQSIGSGEGAAVIGVQRAGDMFKMAEVLSGRKTPRDAVGDLMLRPQRGETEESTIANR